MIGNDSLVRVRRVADADGLTSGFAYDKERTMPELDLLTAYRRMFACPDGELVAWWYFGSCHADVPGYPELLVTAAETVMVYRTETISDDAFRLYWWEIGYFRDPATGEISESWLNPVTGRVVATPKLFEEGPATLTISRDGDGIKIDLVQAHAIVRGVDVTWKIEGGRVFINQRERKARGLPRPDGTLPEEGAADTSEGLTNLSIFASLADIQAAETVYPCAGGYTFELNAPAPWMGFDSTEGRMIIRGRMEKTPVDEVLNPIAWERLKSLLPHAFDGNALKPRWS